MYFNKMFVKKDQNNLKNIENMFFFFHLMIPISLLIKKNIYKIKIL